MKMTKCGKIKSWFCCKCNKRDSVYSDDEFEYNGHTYDNEKSTRRACWCKALKITLIVLFVLLLLAFIAIFVVIPIVFMTNIGIQRFLMFPNILQPDNPEYDNYDKYGAKGIRNLYITVSGDVNLGVWQAVPEDQIKDTENQHFNYDVALRDSKKPIVIYFHGNSGTRIFPLDTYNILRKFFHVIAFDYRSYGDSSDALLSEKAVVADSVEFYKIIMQRTNQKEIYVWGHSLGTALSTHTVKKLNEEGIVPKALVLEAPFSTMREEIPNHPFGKYFAWLPWFAATILDPLETNGFHFKTTTNILDVTCPIMIMHAVDDDVIPYTLGKKLYKVAYENGKDIRFHEIPSSFRANHMNINKYPKLPQLIDEFLTHVNEKNPLK